MKAQMTRTECKIKINEGDVIRFTNARNYDVVIKVTRVSESSWYDSSRNSYGTLVEYSKQKNFSISQH